MFELPISTEQYIGQTIPTWTSKMSREELMIQAQSARQKYWVGKEYTDMREEVTSAKIL